MNQIQLIHQSLLLKSSKQNKSIYNFSVVLSSALEDFAKAYAESVHDQWSYAKVNENRSTFEPKLKVFIFVYRSNKVGHMVNKSMINIVNIRI